jgi:predicted dehydrogenase
VARTPTKIGIIGCGVISGIYIENAKKLDAIECVAVADVNPEAAQFRADQYGVPKACSPDELLADPEIEIVINLTPHKLHAQVGLQVLEAGKNLYVEKPLAVYREDAQKLLAVAAQKGLRVGGAPDTFFGGAWQTARKVIDDGLIGEPIAAFANLHARPSPAAEYAERPTQTGARATAASAVSFYQIDYFQYGVSAAFDRGPYYLNALVHLLGPVKSVVGSTKKTFDERMRFGAKLKVNSPSHIAGILEFASGPTCQFLMTSDVYDTGLPHIEIYGTEGSLRCIDPNNFPGAIYVRRPDGDKLIEVECKHGYNQNSRGIGVADMAVAIKNGRPNRASGEMACHVVDVINAVHESAEVGKRLDMVTTCDQPKALPLGLADWTIDD